MIFIEALKKVILYSLYICFTACSLLILSWFISRFSFFRSLILAFVLLLIFLFAIYIYSI